jgi:hypothetical protein
LATLAVLDPSTGVDDRVTPPTLAGSLRAQPNPFYQQVTFAVYGVADRDEVTILVYDVRGREVAAVPVAIHDGRGTAVWNATGGTAGEIGAGVYFGRLEGVPGASPAKIVCVK